MPALERVERPGAASSAEGIEVRSALGNAVVPVMASMQPQGALGERGTANERRAIYFRMRRAKLSQPSPVEIDGTHEKGAGRAPA